MTRQRTYQTPEGLAEASYDGLTWHVIAHPANSPRAADMASCEAWRDEAGFAHRDWRAGGAAGDALPSDQFSSLRDVAESLIHLAYQRVASAAIRAQYQPQVTYDGVIGGEAHGRCSCGWTTTQPSGTLALRVGEQHLAGHAISA
jgi:hypothetical protein